MVESRDESTRGVVAKTGARRSGAANQYARVEGEGAGDTPKKKNLRIRQSKIDEAKKILGTATETETVEAALDLVIFRKELVEGVRAMRGTNLVNLFNGGGH